MSLSPAFSPGPALLGGVLIGASASLLWWGLGRIAGITGIVGGALQGRGADRAWRLWFLAGLVGGGVGLAWLVPGAFGGQLARSSPSLVVAGLLVGFGTRMANGCTSGHGVCGIGRWSRRSLAATAVFMATAALTVFATGHLRGGIW